MCETAPGRQRGVKKKYSKPGYCTKPAAVVSFRYWSWDEKWREPYNSLELSKKVRKALSLQRLHYLTTYSPQKESSRSYSLFLPGAADHCPCGKQCHKFREGQHLKQTSNHGLRFWLLPNFITILYQFGHHQKPWLNDLSQQAEMEIGKGSKQWFSRVLGKSHSQLFYLGTFNYRLRELDLELSASKAHALHWPVVPSIMAHSWAHKLLALESTVEIIEVINCL